MKLGFDPVDVMLFVNDDMFEQLPGCVVLMLEAGLYSGLKNRKRRLLQAAIVL